MNIVASSDADISRASEGGGSPGSMLRTARIQHNLKIEQVAKELHLDTRIVTAMENDDQAALPEPIFVQGYLRSYARLLGLPADDIVSRYSAQGRPNPPPLSVIGPRRKAPMLPLPSARMTRNVILVLLAGILVWLAYPLVERLVLSSSGETEVQQPGRLDLPPVFEEEPRSDA
ncbi:MAG: helix-turn-helix domain-containing protein, partial [Gammaproteobacteria bacterium]